MTRAGLAERAALKFLATVLGVVSMAFVTAPWERGWKYTPTEEPWMYLVLPQAAAVIVLRSRGRLAWLGIAVGVLMCWPRVPGLRWGAEPWTWYVTQELSDALGNPLLGRALLWVAMSAGGAVAVRAATRLDWGMAFARAGIAMVGSLVVSEALLWFREYWPAAVRGSERYVDVTVYLVPAIVLPTLLWLNWNRIAAWAGASAASVTLTAVLVLDLHRLTPGTAAVAAIVTAVGPVWAYVDWRRSRVDERNRGFEVVPAGIPVTTLAGSQTAPGQSPRPVEPIPR